MKALIVGGGGREHALAWKAAQSERVKRVYVAPGNAGTAVEHIIENVPIDSEDIPRLVAFAHERRIDLTIIGPEVPIVAGVVDEFEKVGLRCFGPSKSAARLESSKAFSKAFLARHAIASADYASFADAAAAEAYIRRRGVPIVVKADGLAAGKGVTIAFDADEAVAAAARMLSGEAFGDAGRRIVVEDYLQGEEASFIALVDGEHILPLASSQDHKPRDEGDTGPNTGGMGAYSPAPVVTEAVHQRILHEIMAPTVAGLAAEGMPYRGFLYAGLMIAADGSPKVLEFNCRAGDPEMQPLLMRLKTDLTVLCDATFAGRLHETACQWDERAALGVVAAAAGYPAQYPCGETISGLDADLPNTKIFHAGTRQERERIVTAGGRVLCVCALGQTILEAQTLAYERLRHIHWPNLYYRRDIGYRALSRNSSANI
jgi:phosphoribosylamine--glycine ligase